VERSPNKEISYVLINKKILIVKDTFIIVIQSHHLVLSHFIDIQEL